VLAIFSRERREVKETPSFSFFQNSVYKEQATANRRCEKVYWKKQARDVSLRAHPKPTNLSQIQTELCVTSSTSHSFE
jgi:hypothetical protein